VALREFIARRHQAKVTSLLGISCVPLM